MLDLASNGIYKEGVGIIKRSFIEKLPFPYKLWILINLETCNFINWSMDGKFICINYNYLSNYLNSLRSIVNVREPYSFVQLLLDYGFVRIRCIETNISTDAILKFQHANFRKKRIDLLDRVHHKFVHVITKKELWNFQQNRRLLQYDVRNMQNCLYFPQIHRITKEAEKAIVAGRDMLLEHEKKLSLLKRMDGDNCFSLYGNVSEIQKSRWKLQAVLQYNTAKELLKKTMKLSRKSGGLLGNTIELPTDMYENPYESAMHFEVDESQPDPIGFFGNADNQSIKQFYGNLLPIYDYDQNCIVPLGNETNASQTLGAHLKDYQIRISLTNNRALTSEQLYHISEATTDYVVNSEFLNTGLSSINALVYDEHASDENMELDETKTNHNFSNILSEYRYFLRENKDS